MPDAPPDSSQAATASEFFAAYFRALEGSDVPYVVLHGYEQYPNYIGSDVDYAVRNDDLPKAARILRETCESRDWAIAQVFHHTVYGYYFVAFNRRSLDQTIKLDVCSHYGRDFSLLLKDEELLGERRTQSGFYVPAIRAEFSYVLAKALAKRKPLSAVAPRLSELHSKDPEGCVAAFSSFTGAPKARTTDVCRGTMDAAAWDRLRQRVMQGKSRNAHFALGEIRRRLIRFLQPAGLVVGFLGVDGSGKSTLLGRLPPLLEPFFRQFHTLHFQPRVFGKRKTGTVDRPHGKPPRSVAASWLKIFYYYTDWLLGYFADLRFRIARSSLVICDRTFDDVVVDPVRYRLQGTSMIADLLRRALPTPNLILILLGSAQVIHGRKSELTLGEIQRQQEVLQALAAKDRRIRVIDASAPAESVAETAAQHILDFMTARQTARGSGL
jgi:thymidylate kinase